MDLVGLLERQHPLGDKGKFIAVQILEQQLVPERKRPAVHQEHIVATFVLDGEVVSGKLRPSSDTKTHGVLYKNFPGIGGICHTHSTYAVAWAQAMKPIPILGTTHADHLATDIPCTEMIKDEAILRDYEEETGNQILQTFKMISSEEVEMTLVAGHGPFTWGTSAEKAVYNSIVLEELAKIALFTLQINPDSVRLKQTLTEKHYYRKHGSDAYYGQK